MKVYLPTVDPGNPPEESEQTKQLKRHIAERLLFRPWCEQEGDLEHNIKLLAFGWSLTELQNIDEQTRKEPGVTFRFQLD